MARSKSELGGKEWERLGLSGEAEPAGDPWVPSWETLLPLLTARGGPSLHQERLAVIQLEGRRDPQAALAHLGAVESADAGGKWLLFQLALARRSQESFERWLATLEGGPSFQLATAALVRRLLFEDDVTDAGQTDRWAEEGPAYQLLHWWLMARQQRWEELAGALDSGSAESAVAAAFLWGELLQQPEQQADRLQRAAEGDLLAAETLFELALRGVGEMPAALDRREAALACHEQLLAERSATHVMRLLKGERGEDRDRPALDERQAAAAWRHLEGLLDRTGNPTRPGELVEQYLAQGRTTVAPLGHALQVRAAELLMGQGQWSEALEALPAEPAEPGLATLVDRYRVLCHAQQEGPEELALALVDRAARQSGEQRALLLMAAAIVGLGADGGQLLASVSKGLDGLSGPEAALVGGALLAAQGRQESAAERAALWSGLYGLAPESQLGALFSFGAGVVLVEAARYDEARQAFERDRSIVGDEPATLGGLALALYRQEAWEELVEVLARLHNVVEDPAGELLRESAYVAVAEAQDVARAVELIHQVLDLRPLDLELLQEAAAIDLRAGHDREAADLLERAAGLAEPALSADLLCARGKVLQDKLGDTDSAEDSFRRALKAHPLHLRSLHGLYHLLVKLQRFRDLPEVLHSLLHLTKTDAGRVKLLVNLSSLHLRLWRTHGEQDDAEKCLQYCDEALTLDERNDVAVKNLVSVCEQLGRWDEIIRRFDSSYGAPVALRALGKAYVETEDWARAAPIFRKLAETVADAQESWQAAVRAGDLYRQRLNDPATAEKCFRWAQERHPTAVEINRRLADLLRSQKRPADLAKVLEAQISDSQPDEQAKLHLELAQLFSGPLAEPVAATRHYEAVLEVQPHNDEALRALEPLLEGDRRHADMARLLERRLQHIESGPEELRILLKLSGIFEELGDEPSVLRMATRLHYLYPNSEPAVDFAERVYQRQRRFSELCELLERRVQVMEQESVPPAQRAVLLKRKGRIELSDLDSASSAADSLTRALELMPEDNETVELLERILSEGEDWQRLLTLYEKRANQLSGTDARIASLHQAARIAQQKLGDEAETARLYERIHGLDPSDAESFGFLERKLERVKDDRRLAGLLEKRAETVASREEAVECLLRAAAICEKIGDPSRAKEIYHRTLRLEPGSPRALKALSRISEALETWEEFLEITRRQIDEEGKPAQKALLFFKCGSVLETKFQREEEAIRYYKEAIRTSASCLPALHSLRDLYSRREDWERVVETLKTESSVWTDKKGKAGVLAQIAELYATRLGDHAQAFKYYREAIRNHPENMDAALALFDAYAAQGSYADAAAWGEVYARQVHQKGSRAQRADFYVRWADVLRRIGRYEEAAQFLVRAQELRPDQPETLYGLLDLCREAPQAYDFARAVDELLQETTKRGDTLAMAILLTACGVLAEQNGEVGDALQFYQRAISAGGHNIRLATPMADLLVLLGKEEEAVTLVNRCREEAREESFTRWIEATQWLVEYEILWKRNYERAVERCEEALEEQPNRDDIRLLLAQVEVMLRRPERAIDEYQKVCDKLAKHGLDLQLLAERYHALGLAAKQAGNVQLAESSWRRSNEIAPSWPYPLIALARSKLARGDGDGAESELAKAGEADHPDLLRASAELAAKRGRLDQATQLYQKLAEAKDPSPDDIVRLAQHQAQAGDGAQALAVLRELIRKGDYQPAFEALADVCEVMGNEGLERRANQVAALGVASDRPSKPPPLVRGPVPRGFWTRIEKDIARHPMDGLWQIVRDGVERALAVEPPPTMVAAYPEVQLAATQMAALSGTRLEIARLEQPGAFSLVFGNRLMVALDVSQMKIFEARTLLAMAVTAIRLGYAALLKLGTAERVEVGRWLGAMLSGETESVPRAAELLGSLSRGKQRQVGRLVSQRKVTGSTVEELASSWLAALDAVCIKVSLLLTEDLPSLVKVMAMQEGIAGPETERGGLLGALPDLSTIIEYYLSDDFQQMRSMLQEDAGGG